VSNDDIERLISERSVVRESFDNSQVAGSWAKAVASYSDARVPGVSTDGALELVYTSCLQATFAMLAARGLRVKSTGSHYKAFYALQRLDLAGAAGVRHPGQGKWLRIQSRHTNLRIRVAG
jgi:hypothetical protein